MNRLDGIVTTWLGVLAALGTTAMVAGAVWYLDRQPAVDYGEAREAKFVPSHAKAGQFIEVCFAEINWHRPECPGLYYWSWLTSDGQLKTPPPHKISNPPSPVRLTNKCRSFQVPEFATPGVNFLVNTYAANKCSVWHEWQPLIATGPTGVPLRIDPP